MNKELTWTADSSMLGDRRLLWDLFKVAVISTLVTFALLALAGWLVDGEPILLPWWVPVMVALILIALFLVAMLIMGNRYKVTYTISPQGIGYASGPRSRGLSRVVLIAGLLARKPGVAGAGAIAASRESLFVPWRKVRRITVDSGQRVIIVKGPRRTLLRLHCPPDIFAGVSEAARTYHARSQTGKKSPDENGKTARLT